MLNKALSISFLSLYLFLSINIDAQDIPEHVSYSSIYQLLDELASEKIIELNSAVKPYSKLFIANKLKEATLSISKLNDRQNKDVKFFFNLYALEMNKLPDSKLQLWDKENSTLTLLQPAFNYRDSVFKMRISPILGMYITNNKNGNITKRWYGANLEAMLGENLSVYGSLRDISIQGELLSRPNFITQNPGYEYKESSTGGDFSDSRGGIKYAWKWGSFGLMKDNILWGDNNNGSIIFSGRTPSFPMISLNLKPVKWFEMQYIHGWLVSNVKDSLNYYVDNQDKKMYRMKNKFIAANMFTLSPVRNFNLSFGNSIIYAESNIQAAYLLPIAFYKSIDHTLTKGLTLENQNSQLFINISSRNIKHLHLFSSMYFDEVSFSRFKPSSAEKNPLSFKLGANLSNFPVQNLSLLAEYTKTNILNYKHSIPALTWASNSYNLGHYLGDNSTEMFLALRYKPIRGLIFDLEYINAKRGNDYIYIRRINGRDITKDIISEPFMKDVIWSNTSYSFNTQYELMNNTYAILNINLSDIKGYDLSTSPIVGESSESKAQEFLNKYSPTYLQGKNTTITVGLSFGF